MSKVAWFINIMLDDKSRPQEQWEVIDLFIISFFTLMGLTIFLSMAVM